MEKPAHFGRTVAEFHLYDVDGMTTLCGELVLRPRGGTDTAWMCPVCTIRDGLRGRRWTTSPTPWLGRALAAAMEFKRWEQVELLEAAYVDRVAQS